MSDEHYVSSLLAASGEGHNTDCFGMAIHSNHSTGELPLRCHTPLQCCCSNKTHSPDGLPLHCSALLQLLVTVTMTPVQEKLIRRPTTPARSPQQPCRVSAMMARTSSMVVQTSSSSGHLKCDVVWMHRWYQLSYMMELWLQGLL